MKRKKKYKMKSITLILLTGCLFSIIYTEEEEKTCEYHLGRDSNNKRIKPSKKEDCTSYKLTKYEKVGGDSCCYTVYKTKNDEEKSCSAYNKKYITKDYIKEYISESNSETENEEYKITSLSIECGCNWLSFSLIFAFLVFIF